MVCHGFLPQPFFPSLLRCWSDVVGSIASNKWTPWHCSIY